MRLLDIALAHLKLRKGRTAFLLLGLVLCLGTLVSFYLLTASLQSQYRRQLEQAGIRFLVTPPAYRAGDAYLGVPVGPPAASSPELLPPEYPEKIRQLGLAGLELVSPKLVVAAEVQGKPVLLCGLDFQVERSLQAWWQPAAGSFPGKREEILAGSELAAALALEPGEQVGIAGKTYRLAGILWPTGGGEDKLFLLDREELAGLTGVQGVSFLELRFQVPGEEAGREAAVAEWTAALQSHLPGSQVTRIIDEQEARQAMWLQVSRFAGYGALLVFVFNWLVMAVAMLSSVKERVGEIGILRAMGYRQTQIARIILLEAGMITGVGGILGFLAGLGLGAWLTALLGGTALEWGWALRLFLPVQVLSWLIGLTAAGYPACRAAQLDPVAALRQL